jgi:mobilization protein NikA
MSKKRRKHAALRKEDQIRVLVTTDEKARIERAAQKMGLAAASWLRSVGLREAAKLENE